MSGTAIVLSSTHFAAWIRERNRDSLRVFWRNVRLDIGEGPLLGWCFPHIPPPAEFVGAAFGGGDYVQTAVVVEVGDDGGDGVWPAGFEGVLLPDCW